MVGHDEQYLAHLMIQNKIYSSDGQSFENLFCQIMGQANSNFELVRAHGSSGDKKNDGFDKSTGTYYQVFAPDDITKSRTIGDAKRKLRDDFEKLYEFWDALCKIQAFYFVINDKYKGVPPEIHEETIRLQKEHLSVKIGIYTAYDLEDTFLPLELAAIVRIVGCMPNPAMQLDYLALTDVINHLMNMPDDSGDSGLNVPDFEEKIAFNCFSDKIASQLRTASYQVGGLEAYFNRNSEYTRNDLQSKFVSAYNRAINAIDSKAPNHADLAFAQMIDDICPNGTVAIRNAVLILMAYYFESCDIFERPQGGGFIDDFT